MNPTFSIEVVTPQKAQELLEKNTNNRPMSERNVGFLLAEMRSGNWRVTGETIKISKTDRLLNGQHTLQAIVKFGKPLELCFARGLDDGIFDVLDTGKKRTSADVLSISGYKNVNALSSAIRAIIAYQSGAFNAKKWICSNTDVKRFADEHPQIHESVNYVIVQVYRKFRVMQPGPLCMLYWILSKKNAEKADIFFEKFATGIDLSDKSPIRILRERFMKDSINKSKLPIRDKVALFIIAWNHYLTGRYVTSIPLSNNYEFPKPI